eukprot:GGOE01062050.1.p1 GENE.GGOE01062050.1~~GGOE01062050.1.p1  ORF type:complete len:538 (+),score=67.89 GGOE01062050.1:162-1775(+)
MKLQTCAARFWALTCFVMLSSLQGMVWLTFAPVVKEASEYFPKLNETSIQWIDSYPALVCIPCLMGSTWLTTHTNGLRRCMYLGAFLIFIGTWLRCGALQKPKAEWSLWMIHISQLINATVGPLVMVTPSLLSAIWFPPSESTRATAAALLANSIGAALAYVAGPGLVTWGGIPALFLGHALIATATLVCMLVSFPSQPPTPHVASPGQQRNGLEFQIMVPAGLSDSDSASVLLSASSTTQLPARVCLRGYGTAQESATSSPSPVICTTAACCPFFLTEYSMLFRCSNFRILMLVYGWVSGAYVAWVSLFDEMFSRDTNYSERYIGMLSFFSNLGYIAGGLVSSWVVDKHIPRSHKAVLYYASGASALLALLFVLSLPSQAPSLLPTLQMKNGRHLLLAGAAGFPIGVIDPVIYEFAAELTYPASEGSSAALLSVGENLGTLLLLQVLAPVTDPETLNYIFILGLGLCSLGLRFLQPRYLRSAADHLAPVAHGGPVTSPTMQPTQRGCLSEPGKGLQHTPSSMSEGAHEPCAVPECH